MASSFRTIFNPTTLLRLGIFFLVIIGIFRFTIPAYAAVITWNGAGDDGTCGGGVGDGNKWSCGANWTGGVAPTSADVATFDATSTKNSTIDANISVSGIDINTGYTGTITQASGATVTVGSGNFDISAGSFVGGGSSIDLNGTFIISGGSFTSTTGNLFIGSTFTISSGSFDPSVGTVVADGGAATWNIVTTETFNNFTINKNTGTTLSTSSGDTYVVTGLLTLTDGAMNTSTGSNISTQGDIIQASTYDGGSIFLNFGNDAVAQTYTINGGVTPNVQVDSASDANDFINVAAVTTFTALTTTSGFAGNIPLYNPSNFELTFTTWAQTQGNYDASSQSSWRISSFVKSGVTPGSFVAPTLVTAFGFSTSWSTSADQTLNRFTLDKTTASTLTFGGSSKFLVSGLLTLKSGAFAGSLYALGDISQESGYGGTTAATGILNFHNDVLAQVYTSAGGGLQFAPIVLFDSAADASDRIDVSSSTKFSGITVSAGFSGVIPFNNPSDFALTFEKWNQSAGTYDASGQTGWTINTELKILGGSFVAPSIVTFASSTIASLDVTTSQTFQSLTINRSSTLNLGASDIVIVVGTLTLTNGFLNTATAEVQAQGDVIIGSGWDAGTAPLAFTGSAVQTFNLTGATGLHNTDIRVNKSGGQVNLASALVMDAANQDLTVQEGIFNTAGNSLTINGSTGTFVVEDGGNFQLQGAETFTFNAGLPSLSTGSTVTYTGNGNAGANTYIVTTLKATYSNLTVNSTDGATDIFQLGSALDVNGNFVLTAGTFDVSGSSYAITLAGDWTNTGTFSAQAGTVTLDGTSQAIVGTTTFNALTKSVVSAATLTLPASTTTTVTGALTLNGSAGQLLSLRSSSLGTQTNLYAAGSRSLTYLDVQDNNATHATAMSCGLTCTDSGNNTNWLFAVSGSTISGTTSEGGRTASFTVFLYSQPSADVTVPVSSSDTTEGTVSTSLLTFTTSNWDTPQTVTVAGIDDVLVDGAITYSIILGVTTSSDVSFNGLNPSDITVRNLDNDAGPGYVPPSSGGTPSSVIVRAPAASETLLGGVTYIVSWAATGATTAFVNIYLSLDAGLNFTRLATHFPSASSYGWTVPFVNSSKAVIKVAETDLVTETVSGNSGVFIISTPAPVWPSFANSPVTGLEEPVTPVLPGDLVRGNTYSTVYYIDENLGRRPYMNAQIFFTYQPNFNSVRWVTDATLPLLPLGSSMPPKPNTVLVKIQSSPTVYSVSDNGILHKIADELMAVELFGSLWSDYVIDLDSSVFVDYSVGAPMTGEETINRTILIKRDDLK